ncbi:MAG: thioredoxin family protein [Bacteroidetes bacterium]|nr:thioredoxin family protein [Bacteroidota bacterium]
MKKLFCFLFLPLLFSGMAYTQEINKIIMDPRIDREVVVGYCNRDGLQWGEFLESYVEEYDIYTPEIKYLKKIRKKLDDTKIVIVLGTWCSDSKTQVPRFLKVLDQIDFNESNLTMIGVDRSKTAGDLNIRDLSIERVPTFIFYHDGFEIGRIIETPETTLERDTYKILRKK